MKRFCWMPYFVVILSLLMIACLCSAGFWMEWYLENYRSRPVIEDYDYIPPFRF